MESAGPGGHTGWWFGTFFIFPYIGNLIIPTDELIFFRGVGIPPTSISLYDCVAFRLDPSILSTSQPPTSQHTCEFFRTLTSGMSKNALDPRKIVHRPPLRVKCCHPFTRSFGVTKFITPQWHTMARLHPSG